MSSSQSAVHRSMSNASKASKERRITVTLASRDTPGSMSSEQARPRATEAHVAAGDEQLLAVVVQQLHGEAGELERVGDDAAVELGDGGDDGAPVLGDQVVAVAEAAAVEGGEVGEAG